MASDSVKAASTAGAKVVTRGSETCMVPNRYEVLFSLVTFQSRGACSVTLGAGARSEHDMKILPIVSAVITQYLIHLFIC